MNFTNQATGFGTLFSTLAALTSPAQEFVTSRRDYRDVPGLRLRTGADARLGALAAAFRSGHERALATLELWRRRTRERQALLSLDDHILRDVGLTRREVELEGRKPFWRA